METFCKISYLNGVIGRSLQKWQLITTYQVSSGLSILGERKNQKTSPCPQVASPLLRREGPS